MRVRTSAPSVSHCRMSSSLRPIANQDAHAVGVKLIVAAR